MFNYTSCSIRPIEIMDKNLILQWRNSDQVRSNMYNDHLISQEEHESWFTRALVDTSAVYLVFLYESRPIGFISFTSISAVHRRCYWAFYLGEVDVERGSGSVLEFFALDYAFFTLEIQKLCCEVFAFNNSVIKLHQKFGFIQEGRFVEHYKKNEGYEDIVCLAKFAYSWTEERPTFENRLFGT
jgi:UDP-4-amino-4,6-dideoxy-N-acetyl-beta-L-altrosamine N-acetyltransferase